ncbi:hypothetical protein HDU76_000536 [Blyttiomyces sp. JEL0837]|nr:hypothetical protein HDU76_000536 [Blyttiomyces sp. JEL0837]
MSRFFRAGEPAIRAKEVMLRKFWQQESNVPVYARRKYDGVWFGLSVALLGTGIVASGFQAVRFIQGPAN